MDTTDETAAAIRICPKDQSNPLVRIIRFADDGARRLTRGLDTGGTLKDLPLAERGPILPALQRIHAARGAIGNLWRQTFGGVPLAEREWGGANVVVAMASRGGRYREIITSHALSVSWLFERLRDVFDGLVDSETKFEFYGRLEIAANRELRRDAKASAIVVAHAMLTEASRMLDEMEAGTFTVLPIALGTAVAADFT